MTPASSAETSSWRPNSPGRAPSGTTSSTIGRHPANWSPRSGSRCARHGAELQYFFAFDSTAPLNRSQERLADRMQAYWTSFATSGSPHAAGGPHWPKFTAGQPRSMSFRANQITVRDDVAIEHRCDYWFSIGLGR
ncbi:carboxylesterase family protein [Micromonospora sp. NPDC005171]|uniref:carboxylesterase family protein n=1 Tax=Micromonospora sp. NPDC005171 TaxID=3156866 RepID=UPI0033AD540B